MRLIFLAVLLLSTNVFATETSSRLENIKHIVVIYLENHSFDNLYGLFPHANGINGETYLQTDLTGKPFAALPPVMNSEHKPPQIDGRFPPDLPNKPFQIEKYVPADQKIGDLVHRYYQNQAQINGGRNDLFAALSDAGGLVMGYYDGRELPLWEYAEKYTLADNFFQGAFGGSFLNHFWLICACTPRYENAPEEIKAVLDNQGVLLKDGAVTSDGYAVNTLQPATSPVKPGTLPSKQLPLQSAATIGDRLTENGVSWTWYSGGWNDAIAGRPSPFFQFHHQPFGYFSRYSEGSRARNQHLKDETDLLQDIENGNLPSVSFFKPLGDKNEHPGYADLVTGEQHIAKLLARFEKSPQWKDMVVIVTYDENGGFWDHARPPKKDRWGPGTRVPTIIVSPYAKRRFVDHTEYDTTSILRLIETRFRLQPLGERDANAHDMTNALQFLQ